MVEPSEAGGGRGGADEVLPALYEDWVEAACADASPGAVRETVERHRPRVQKLRDPFTPIGEDRPGARARERVLWEDDGVFVLVDAFEVGTQALVIPKAPALFPTDLADEGLRRLAVVSAACSRAFERTGAEHPSRIWIHPPEGLTVAKLHVCVHPGLPRPRVPERFWGRVAAALDDELSAAQDRLSPSKPKTGRG